MSPTGTGFIKCLPAGSQDGCWGGLGIPLYPLVPIVGLGRKVGKWSSEAAVHSLVLKLDRVTILSVH